MGHEIVTFRGGHRRFQMSPLVVAFALLARFGREWLTEHHPDDQRTRDLLAGWLDRYAHQRLLRCRAR